MNQELEEEYRLKYIQHPELVWFNFRKSKLDIRFTRDFKAPIDYFNSLFTDDIIAHICKNTGDFKLNGKRSVLSPNDLRKFFALELMRGIIGVRNVKHMWSSKGIVIDYPQKEHSLGKNHWFAISSSLNFDPTYVHEKLNERYQHHVVPGFDVTIDEVRIPSHHYMNPKKNHNRDKPDIWAIESKTLHADNGYLVAFTNPVVDKPLSPSEAVFEFSDYLRTTGRRYNLVMDSNFLSALDLPKLNAIGLEGTISCKYNRPSWIWKDGLAHRLPKSYTRVASSPRLCCLATHNKGTPKIATTLCYARENKNCIDVKQRRDVLRYYDNFKGKADYFGHLYKSQFPIGHHKNWLTCLICGWFYFTVTNSYLLYSARFDHLNHKEFLLKLSEELFLM